MSKPPDRARPDPPDRIHLTEGFAAVYSGTMSTRFVSRLVVFLGCCALACGDDGENGSETGADADTTGDETGTEMGMGTEMEMGTAMATEKGTEMETGTEMATEMEMEMETGTEMEMETEMAMETATATWCPAWEPRPTSSPSSPCGTIPT